MRVHQAKPDIYAPIQIGLCGVILQEDDPSGKSEEVRFSLPGMPAPAVMLCLLAAVGELHRAGGASLATHAVQLLAWHLSSACLASLW